MKPFTQASTDGQLAWVIFTGRLREFGMLVLNRHRDEQVCIGDGIVVTIVDIRGDKVRLGIDAPEDVPVHRREVYDRIQLEKGNQDAKQPNAG